MTAKVNRAAVAQKAARDVARPSSFNALIAEGN
jgi:hypothetical protein